jgi:hypothetical protein
MEGFSFASALDLNMGYYHINLDSDALSNVKLYSHGITKNKNTDSLTYGYQDFHDPDVIQNVMSKLVHNMEFVKTNMLS